MKTIENTTKAYDSLIRLLKKQKGLIDLDIKDIEFKKERDLLLLELNDLGIPINYISNTNYVDLYNGWIRYVNFKSSNGYSISCPDDGRQPVNERLIKVSFSTGAYIFGEQYDTKTFNEFFNELKSYGYRYIDSANSSIYYDLITGAKVYKYFKDLYSKYLQLANERNKQNEIDKLKKQLQELENQ